MNPSWNTSQKPSWNQSPCRLKVLEPVMYLKILIRNIITKNWALFVIERKLYSEIKVIVTSTRSWFLLTTYGILDSNIFCDTLMLLQVLILPCDDELYPFESLSIFHPISSPPLWIPLMFLIITNPSFLLRNNICSSSYITPG